MFMDSFKFYLRFNWICGGLDCKKNWFLSQFRLLLEEIKVLGSNYNFEELIWSDQGLNCIIIEVSWSIRDLIETIRNQGPNRKRRYNQGIQLQLFRGAWLQNCENIQGPNQKYHLKVAKRCRFRGTIHRFSKQEPFQQQMPLIMGNISQLLSLYRYHCNNGPERFHYKKKRMQFWL